MISLKKEKAQLITHSAQIINSFVILTSLIIGTSILRLCDRIKMTDNDTGHLVSTCIII